MSRTDAHAPLHVRLARRELAAEASHDHRRAPCDLPDRPPYVAGGTSCRWTFAYSGVGVCSCWMCHAGPQHRADRRTARRSDRATLRRSIGCWPAGDPDALDSVVAPGRYRW